MPDNDSSAGATPAAGGATPSQTPPAPPAAGTPPQTPPPAATDGSEALGDAGKRALDAMKAERDAAKRDAKAEKDRADALELASKSESEQAILKARSEGEAAAIERLAARLRESAVREALIAAGAQPDFVPLAARGSEFEALTVSETGDVTGVVSAIETFKAANPKIFSAPAAPGTADGGSRGGGAITKEQVIAWSKDPAAFEQHRDEIHRWQVNNK